MGNLELSHIWKFHFILNLEGGINLTIDNESSLNFSFEESVWFRKGQELDELLSISLEPEIAIEAKDQYVFIRGALHLSGEYYKTITESKDDYELDAPNTVHSVLEREDDSLRFSHRFPLDITIPAERIDDTNSVHVEVVAFDYEISDFRCLNITADILISGLHQRKVKEPILEEQELENSRHKIRINNETENQTPIINNDEIEALLNEADDDTNRDSIEEEQFSDDESVTYDLSEENRQPFVIEVKKERVSNSERLNSELPTFNVVQQIVSESFVNDLKNNETKDADEIKRLDVKGIEVLKSSAVEQLINNLYPKVERKIVDETDDDELETNNEKDSRVEEVQVLQNIIDQDEERVHEGELNLSEQNTSELEVQFNEGISQEITAEVSHEHEISAEEEVILVEEKPKKKKKTLKEKITNTETLSLTEFFSRQDENIQTQLKLCIVQPGETVSYLADKYQIKEQRILHVNKLDITDELYEGQVLYIPISYD